MKKIEMNFVLDWQNSIIEEMKEEGLEFSESEPKDSLIIWYLNYLRRKVSKQPRKVYKSQEFSCPEELEKGLSNLIGALENGDDITPYLSKKIDELNYKDGMFNDWRIHHLHLGERMEGKFIKRTGPLLYALFTEHEAYLINIYSHKNWTKKDVLQTIQYNWPNLIEPYKLKGVEGLANEYSEGDHQKLRNAGITVLIELEDKGGKKFVIAPLGMGIATSGDSLNDIKVYHQEIKGARNLEDLVNKNIDYIEGVIKGQGIEVPEILKFRLIHEEGKYIIREENTKLIFNLIE